MRALSVLCAATLLGCASSTPARVADPKQTLSQFGVAVEADDPRAAYALLSPRLRQELTFERFQVLWRENHAELAEVARSIRDTAPHSSAHARVDLADGERVVMVLEDGAWRVQGGVLDAQALATPLDAVAELRRALSRRSLPALLRVLSLERRAAWAAALDQSLEQTADPLDLQVEIHGDQAVVKLTGGGEILLKREAGSWHVWDVR